MISESIEERIASRLAALRAERGWTLDELDLEVGEAKFQLEKGYCVRYVLSGPSRFKSRGRRAATYIVALVHP